MHMHFFILIFLLLIYLPMPKSNRDLQFFTVADSASRNELIELIYTDIVNEVLTAKQ